MQKKQNEYSVGFIGCGKIANDHADVLKYLGINIQAVATRPNSQNIKRFADKYKVSNTYSSFKDMIELEKLDALWVTIDWTNIEDIILDILSYDLPTFVEKPIALNSFMIKQVQIACRKRNKKLQVGYNRRFYNHIPIIKNILCSSKIRSVLVEIPENVSKHESKLFNNRWIQNSSHILDLLLYFLGEYDIINSFNSSAYDDGFIDTFNLLLLTKNEIPIHVVANWNVPANYNITFYLQDSLLKLSPLEMGYLYRGFDIIEPDNDIPIRQYKPKLEKYFSCNDSNDKFKPGFLNQAKFFFEKHNNMNFAFINSSINDILFITDLIEKIQIIK
jgi:predicted dehydrogenase